MDHFTPQPPQQYPPPQYLPQSQTFQPSAYDTQAAARRGNKVGLVIGGVVTAAVICASVGVGFLKGQRAASAFGGGGTGSTRVSTAKANAAASTLATLNAQVQLYRLQHMDNLPDFARYPGWEQLSQFTDANGLPSTVGRAPKFKYGPYVRVVPANVLNNLSNVVTLHHVGPGTKLNPYQKAGFVMDAKTGRFWMTDAGGSTVIAVESLQGGRGGR